MDRGKMTKLFRHLVMMCLEKRHNPNTEMEDLSQVILVDAAYTQHASLHSSSTA